MRIIIEIDGLETASARPEINIKVIPPASTIDEAPDTAMPPAEILKTATEFGADSAGPAPTLTKKSDPSYSLEMPPQTGLTVAEPCKIDAGMAPDVYPDDESE